MKTKEKVKKTKELETVKSDIKKLSAAGKWLYDSQSPPFMSIIDMRAVLK
jgi:hypothetical protein